MEILSSSRTVASSILCTVILCLLLFGLQSNLPRYTLAIHDQLTQSTITETKSSDLFQPLHYLIDSLSLRPPTEKPNPRPSILIFQHLPYFTPLYRASYATHKLYSEIWGYGYKCSRYSKINEVDGTRKVNNGKSMNKIYALYKIFKEELKKDEKERYDWIFMTDVDTIISNPSIPIHFLLPPPTLDPPPMFLGNQDHNGFNAGVLISRIHPHTLTLLQWVINEFEKSLERLKEGELPRNDQVLLSTALNQPELGYSKGFYKIPKNWFNAYFLGQGDVQLQVHLVNRLEYEYRFTPVIEENFRKLREAQELLRRSGKNGDGHGRGLDLMYDYELAWRTGEEYWKDAKNGIENMKFLWD